MGCRNQETRENRGGDKVSTAASLVGPGGAPVFLQRKHVQAAGLCTQESRCRLLPRNRSVYNAALAPPVAQALVAGR